jgi:transketolase
LPANVKRVAVEAGATGLWYKYADKVFGIDSFGKSASAEDLFKYFKLNAKDIIKQI